MNAESDSQYLLRLFRTQLLHSVEDDGAPVLDVGHVVHALNKLDAGLAEKTVLSR
jgi:PAB-dependent poly(A)-specific ribonuclease subunit 3